MARSGDTKLLCHVAQMSIALSGVSLWPLSGGKSLVLCQPGSQGTPRAYSSRRSRGDLLYLGRAVTTSPQTRGGLCPGASGYVPPLCGTTILLRRSAYLTVAPLVTVCNTHVNGSRPAPHHAGLCPRRPRAGLHMSGLGGTRTHPRHAAAYGPVARGVVRRPRHALLQPRAGQTPRKALWHSRMRRKPRRIPCSNRCC